MEQIIKSSQTDCNCNADIKILIMNWFIYTTGNSIMCSYVRLENVIRLRVTIAVHS